MWFKNLMTYRITKPLEWDLEQLQTQLESCRFHPCGAQDQSKFGWGQPLRGSDLLYFFSTKQILLVAKKEEKILPANVVKRELDERIESVEQKENRKLKKVEKQTLKDDVVMNLLPRAFSKNQHTALWIDTENQLIHVDAASSKRAEDALALLRKSLGSLPVVPLAFAQEPSTILTHWITQDSLPHWLIALEEAELRGSQEDSVIRCKKQPLENEEILALLQEGKKVVSKLALEWEDTLTFVFNEDCTIKRLKFADNVREKNEDILKEDFAQRFDADFVLMTGIIAKLTENLLDEFGGEKARL
ncbi:recombination-associated protein RdgC [Rodentibacter caecimuris]|uniref:recombination-associated protein RdgC n=1 Tax=Rodentibacter caecimuris TaxID=1796644 RepID=UPI0013A08610|nr:recombination-associated protein RdgC [Rodentibacter heylii]MCQ9124058.1 recombination-associated protein RdgC [Rodentibacter heylii]MCX2961638.1 recombination-associated protein RdgC [Rodentibacter heylii]QIA77513.1 recombination-associated protein RdgC [Rodentibacter heylii]